MTKCKINGIEVDLPDGVQLPTDDEVRNFSDVDDSDHLLSYRFQAPNMYIPTPPSKYCLITGISPIPGTGTSLPWSITNDTWEEDHKNDYKFSVPFLGGQYRIHVDMFEKKSTIRWRSCDLHNLTEECSYCKDGDEDNTESITIDAIIDKGVTLEEIKLYLTFRNE